MDWFEAHSDPPYPGYGSDYDIYEDNDYDDEDDISQTTTTGGARYTKEVTEMAALLERANEAYRNTDKPIMTDEAYDTLLERLRSLKPNHPFLKRIGALPNTGSVRLPFIMNSLDKIKDDPVALAKFEKRYPGTYVISDKLDGNCGGLHIVHGKPHLYSRGDGTTGQNLDAILPFLRGLPSFYPTPSQYPIVSVRGELILSKQSWESVKHLGTHPRNLVAGTLHRKSYTTPEAQQVASLIEFVAYELIEPRMTYLEGIQWLKHAGFRVVSHHVVTHLSLPVLQQELIRRREDSPYECDGLVIAYNCIAPPTVPGQNPSHAFALKSMSLYEEAIVTVTHIEWNVSKDALLKPIAHFTPVVLGGATIQKATAFNAAFVQQHRLGPGAQLIIVRSGDVIPHIKEIVKPATRAQMPTMEYTWSTSGVDAIATHATEETELQIMIHFVKKMEAKGMGPALVTNLYNAGINTIPALWNITPAQLNGIPGVGPKTADLILSTFRELRANATMLSLAIASNVFGMGFGERLLKPLFQVFANEIHARVVPTITRVEDLEGMGPSRAAQFIKCLPLFYTFLQDLGWNQNNHPIGVIPLPPHAPVRPPRRKSDPKIIPQAGGLNVVFSGIRDKALEKRIEAVGGKVSTAVTSKTTHLIVKDPTANTTKIQQARHLNIPVITLGDPLLP